ncbi:MAG: membrane protein of unknown function [Promethearchaeota archaeon]|nr:MAG: membrane protein of unknown function [Candidatus Lokiarchaeota archaeon]
MFCPNCGKKVETEYQNFCQYCGAKLQLGSEEPQAPVNTNTPTFTRNYSAGYVPRPVYPARSTPNTRTPQSYYSVPFQSLRRKKGEPGNFSKICFAIAFIAFLTSLFTFTFGSISVFYFAGPAVMFLVKVSIIIVLHITGFALGVISIGIKKTVERTEPINNYEQAGLVLGIFAIIFNVIGAISVVYGVIRWF